MAGVWNQFQCIRLFVALPDHFRRRQILRRNTGDNAMKMHSPILMEFRDNDISEIGRIPGFIIFENLCNLLFTEIKIITVYLLPIESERAKEIHRITKNEVPDRAARSAKVLRQPSLLFLLYPLIIRRGTVRRDRTVTTEINMLAGFTRKGITPNAVIRQRLHPSR